MKFRECLRCIFRDEEEVCEDCGSGEQFEEDDGLSFEDNYRDDDEDE